MSSFDKKVLAATAVLFVIFVVSAGFVVSTILSHRNDIATAAGEFIGTGIKAAQKAKGE